MRAVVLNGPYQVAVENVPVPAPAPDQVLIEVESCGVCGSDIRYYMGENPWALHTLGRHVPNPPNIILGHELSGTVVKAGSGAFAALVGRRVAVLPYKECGVCPECIDGRPNLCQHMLHTGHSAGWGEKAYYDGGMADLCPMWGERCFPIPDTMSAEEAGLVDFVGVAVHAVRRAGDVREKDVAVIGAGPVGLSIAQVARAWGARRVFLSERSPLAVRIAKGMGFERAESLGDRSLSEWLRAGTGGAGAAAIWDTVGSASTLTEGLAGLARHGVLVNLAVHDVQPPLPMLALAAERSLTSSSNSTPADVRDAIELVARGAVDVHSMVTHRFPLEEAPLAFARLVEKDAHGMFKAVIDVKRAAGGS